MRILLFFVMLLFAMPAWAQTWALQWEHGNDTWLGMRHEISLDGNPVQIVPGVTCDNWTGTCTSDLPESMVDGQRYIAQLRAVRLNDNGPETPGAFSEPAVLDLNSTQTTPEFPLGVALSARWDPSSNEAVAQINSYEWQMDGDAAWVPANLPIPQASYSMNIPQARLTAGNHTFRVRARNAVGVGPVLSADFIVTLPLPTAPTAPGGGVIVPTTPVASIDIPKAITLANAWAQWVYDRDFTTSELGWLGGQHGPQVPTKETVRNVLTAAYSVIH